jgi:drug/metabolite transporter (DMT)-like permease
MEPKRKKAYLALLINTILWGAALPLVKPALSYITPSQFLYFRYLLAAPLMLPFLIFLWLKIKPSLKVLSRIVLLEFFGTPLSLMILYQGLKQTSAIEASLIGATGPLFTTLGGIIFLHEKEENREWLGLIISFAGTLLLVFEPLLTGRNHQAAFSFSGNLMIIGYNILWTTYLLLAKKHYQKIPKLFVSSLSYLVALISFSLLLGITATPTPISLLTIPAVAIASIYMALFGSIVAFTLYIYAQDLIEASEACLFTYLSGVVAIPFSVILLNESVTWPMIIATLIISLGVFLAEYRPQKIRN